jgi:hypothetical protein
MFGSKYHDIFTIILLDKLDQPNTVPKLLPRPSSEPISGPVYLSIFDVRGLIHSIGGSGQGVSLSFYGSVSGRPSADLLPLNEEQDREEDGEVLDSYHLAKGLCLPTRRLY